MIVGSPHHVTIIRMAIFLEKGNRRDTKVDTLKKYYTAAVINTILIKL